MAWGVSETRAQSSRILQAVVREPFYPAAGCPRDGLVRPSSQLSPGEGRRAGLPRLPDGHLWHGCTGLHLLIFLATPAVIGQDDILHGAMSGGTCVDACDLGERS